jgi:hypothetical protein
MQMKIMLADESLLPDLLAFLRTEGCVVYYESSALRLCDPAPSGKRRRLNCDSS